MVRRHSPHACASSWPLPGPIGLRCQWRGSIVKGADVGHYKSNVRDLEFNLFEVLQLEKVLATGEFGDLDADSIRDMLSEAARLAEGPLAESFAESDRHPPTFDPDTHAVTLPAAFKESFRAWQQGEWFRIGLSEDVGGVPAPSMLAWAINEFPLGAQPAAFMYLAGPVLAGILHEEGNAQQKHWAAMAVERNWGATMVLTEPDAGSDVGAGRTKAVEQPDGTWHLDGVKRFITSGDSDDLFENIVHMVLARPEGAGPGTKGLSLFMVPKFLPDPETGEPGERNGVYVTGLEHKMGLKVSATCELTFGQHGTPAVGYLVGDTHNGIAQMFKIIEYARMMVGTKAISTLSTGYLNALDYAKTRIQGADLTQMTDKTAPRVSILHHPDVRRALMTQKAYAEGLRALYLYTAAHQDVGGGERRLRRGRRDGGPRQRPAAADRQGRRVRTGLPDADGVAADLRRLGLPAGLSDRAVHPRREDRLALRGHHRDPGAGLLLPQDRPRPGRRAGPRRRRDPGVPRRRVGTRRNSPTAARGWRRRWPTCRRWSAP